MYLTFVNLLQIKGILSFVLATDVTMICDSAATFDGIYTDTNVSVEIYASF